jgi:hypothetical protein
MYYILSANFLSKHFSLRQINIYRVTPEMGTVTHVGKTFVIFHYTKMECVDKVQWTSPL